MMLNIGLIGCGKWSKNVIKEIQDNNNFILQGIVCKNNNNLIKNSKIKIYINYEEMINNKDIDCLYIAKNPEINIKVLEGLSYKKPIIFEKPISENFEIGSKIYNYSINNKVCFMTNLPNIYSDTFEVTKDFLSSNYNKIIKVKIIEGNYGPFRKNIHPILDWGIHPLTYVIKIFGYNNLNYISHKFLKKDKNNNIYISKFNVPTNFKFNIDILTGNFFKKKIRLLKIYMKDGKTFLNDFNNHKVIYNNKVFYQSKMSPMQNLLNKFAKNIKNKTYREDSEMILHSAQSIKIINDNI